MSCFGLNPDYLSGVFVTNDKEYEKEQQKRVSGGEAVKHWSS
ncbi:hypothetical protein ACO0LB_13785 [Undibacterium sp. SXout7W]